MGRTDEWVARQYPIILLALYAILWIPLALTVENVTVWLLENALVFAILAILAVTYRPVRLSNLSYTLILAYLFLHTIGAYYTYAGVPFGHWLQSVYEGMRNPYDRVVHFSFGLLLAYPVREVFLRVATTRGVWGYWFPIELTFALSAIYELLEWGIATLGGGAGATFIGSQGDPWDAQNDMALAGLGSVVGMTVVALVHYAHNPHLLRDWRRSLRVMESKPLDEVRLARQLRRRYESTGQERRGRFL